MRKLTLIIIFLSIGISANAQSHKTQNLIIITTDGFRWQEVFTGASGFLISNNDFVNNPQKIEQKFWAYTPEKRRKKLMPFLWNIIAKKGQIYGDRKLGNKVNVANPYWFSYPGYNEIFTGFPDKEISSNEFPANPNTNVLGYINKQSGFQGSVAVFTTWDAFPRILNEKRSGLLINTNTENVGKNPNGKPLTRTQRLLNQYQDLLPTTERHDALTFMLAMQYLKVNHPRVLYIAFDQTDAFAHGKHYDTYLKQAHKLDFMIHKLWSYLQSESQYKNKTTLFITTDHGRGRGSKWTTHGSSRTKYSNQIWFAVIGPDTPATGVVETKEQLYQKQFAQTLAHFLGLDFKANHPVGQRIKSVVKE